MIRPASEKDVKTIQNIVSRAWYVAYGDILSQKQSEYMLDMMYSRESLLKQMRSKQSFAIIYDLGDMNSEPIGFVSFECGYQNSNETVKIHKLYLLPEVKGRGLGELLIRYVEQEARKLNLNTISLNMNKFNPSFGFYKHLGFIKVKEENIDIGNGFIMEDYVLEKQLNY